MSTNRNKAKLASLIVSLLFLSGVILHCTLIIVWGNRVKTSFSQMRAKGQPVTAADLAGPKIPDNENGAVIYTQAFKAVALPARKDEEACRRLLFSEECKPDLKDWEDARNAVARNQAIIPLIELAVSHPKCRFPVNWQAAYEADFPHLKKLKNSSRLTAASAVIKARDGRTDEATELLKLAFRMNEALKDEPSLVSQLARMQIIRSASHALRETLKYSDLSTAQARSIYELLSDIDTVPGFIKGLEGERALALTMFDSLFRKMPSDPNNPRNKGVPKPLVEVGGKWTAFKTASYRHLDEHTYLQFMERFINASHIPYCEAKVRDLFPTETDVPRYTLLTKLMINVVDGVGAARDIPNAEISGS